MEIEEAIQFIKAGIVPDYGTWADIGAGSGVFTNALLQILKEGKVIAVDKNPHMLYRIKSVSNVTLDVMEGDFNKPLDLPVLDGILMANSLHYAEDPESVLNNIIRHLKPGGKFILVEYDTEKANNPWVPFPISKLKFLSIAPLVSLHHVKEMGRKNSIYQDGEMYVLSSKKTI